MTKDKLAKKAKKAAKKAKKVAKAANKLIKAEKVLKGSGAYRAAMPAPKQHVLAGRGDYVDNIVNAGAGIVGKGLRKGIGYLGDVASSLFGNLFGDGDYVTGSYQPKANSLMGSAGVPAVVSSGARGTVIRHREFLTTIQSSSGFQIQSFNINPGLPSTFPWGNTPASAYQRWKLLGCVLCYAPNVDAYGGGNINGKVCLSARYDMNDPAPINMVEAENCQFAVSGRPAQPIMMAVECAPDTVIVNFLNIRTGSLPSGYPLQFYDHCIVDVANTGQVDATTLLGSIYLSYEIELMMPIDLAVVGSLVLSDKFNMSSCTSAAPLGTAVATSTSTLGGSCTGTTYTFPSYVQSGNWLVKAAWVGGGASATAPLCTTSGCEKLEIWPTASGPDLAFIAYGAQATAGTDRNMAEVCVQVTSASATVTFSNVTLAGTTYGTFIVTPLNANIVTLARNKRMFELEWKKMDEEKKRETDFVEKTVRDQVSLLLDQFRAMKVDGPEESWRLRPPPGASVEHYHEEKDGGEPRPPPRARKRVAEPESGDDVDVDDSASMVALKVRSRSTPKS